MRRTGRQSRRGRRHQGHRRRQVCGYWIRRGSHQRHQLLMRFCFLAIHQFQIHGHLSASINNHLLRGMEWRRSTRNVNAAYDMYSTSFFSNSIMESYLSRLLAFFFGHNLFYFGNRVTRLNTQSLKRVSLASFKNSLRVGVTQCDYLRSNGTPTGPSCLLNAAKYKRGEKWGRYHSHFGQS